MQNKPLKNSSRLFETFKVKCVSNINNANRYQRGMNMKNIANLMKQAQEMQKKMATLQDDLKNSTITAESGGGMVKATLNGKGEMTKIEIDASIISADDKETLEDLIVAATNNAKNKVDQLVQEKTKQIMSGMQLPDGLSLPE